MKKVLALLVAAVLSVTLVVSLVACNDKGNGNTLEKVYENVIANGDPTQATGYVEGTNKDIKVALITLHDENSTYDKNFIDAFKAAIAAKGLTEANYAITTADEKAECYDKAAKFARDGYTAVFADSFGHESFIMQAAEEFPDVQFYHATGTHAHTEKDLPNFHNAFASIYEGRYVAGVAAGLKLQSMYETGALTTKNFKVGYVGAWPYAEVISGYTSWFLGVKSVIDTIEGATLNMEVRYTNSWYDETAERTTAQALIDMGCQLISQHADSMGAPTACETAGIPNVSYNGSTEANCPNTFIISSRINWQPYFELMLNAAMGGSAVPNEWTGTFASGSVELTALGATAPAAGTQQKLEAVIAQLEAGTLKVFDCSKFTVGGKKLTSYTADVDDAGDFKGETEVVKTEGGVTYFAESYYRSAPYFDVIIDGINAVK
ncbi:MAG: BMP family ABC transporter substrate-binding protein [Clostridia bacterium]|nr:BMP family ABC transporter substrate-binding protein [Clostridia bacterium]